MDGSGRVTRASFSGSGDSDVETLIEGDALRGVMITDALPDGLKMPIVLRTSARKPASMASR